MKKIKSALKFAFLPLDVLNKLIFKNKNKLFFYSNLGFRDNVFALYEYALKNHKDKKIIVSTDEYKKYAKTAPENVKFVSPLGGIVHFLNSKYCFYSFGKYPIKPARNQKVVNLWHGMPLKRIGNMEKGHETDNQNYFTHTIATSPFFAEIMKKSFNASDGQIILTPQPRCDDMFVNSEKPGELCGYDKIIFWLPTFRVSKRLSQTDGQISELNPFDENLLSDLSKILVDKKSLLIIKPHPMDDVIIPKSDYENIKFITEKFFEKNNITLYSLLSFADVMLTDYSSVYFDYLMLDRPIGFVCPDIDEYSKNRGFVIDDAQSIMPGKMIKSKQSLCEFLISAPFGKDEFSEKRKEINKLLNPYMGKSGCKCVLENIEFYCREETL